MSTTPKALYRDEGIVLRTQKLGEADRIVTVLTRRTGKVRAVAKGVRRTKSKFGARVHLDLNVTVLGVWQDAPKKLNRFVY